MNRLILPSPTPPCGLARPSGATLLRRAAMLVSAWLLAACNTVPLPQERVALPQPATPDPTGRAAVVTPQSSAAWQWADSQPLPEAIARGKSVWTPARWSELPGWGFDALHEAWNAWLRSCERPAPGFGPVCA
ncbi:MAG: hypothetical protein RIS48_1021, partial [Pseudomonadota bacterium]